MFTLYNPWFLLLLPLPFFIRWFASRTEATDLQTSPVIHFTGLQRIQSAFPKSFDGMIKSQHTFTVLLSLAWIFLIFALAQPEKVNEFRHVKNKGYDLMLAVDISASMQAIDLASPSEQISRLDVTKDVVGKFVLGRQGDRVGLVTFGQHAYLHVPLTLDTISVSKMLNDLVAGMAGNATAIGDAIGLSVRTLRDRPEGSRVLVLLTDGEDNSSSIPPLEAAKLAKQYGIRIFTIGVGKNGPVPFPMGNGRYGMANLSFNEDLLKEIAAMTDGQYFQAKDQSMLASIYSTINELVKTESNEAIFMIRDPFYYYPLVVAMLCIVFLSFYQLLYRRIAGES